MSVTNIPTKVRQLLMAKAAGRCQFRGCNKDITTDPLTKQTGKFSCFAHIVADSPDGPRGDPARSAALAKDINNIMVLCFDHHKLIDVEDVAGHPEDLLLQHKAEHEQRIREVTALDVQHQTHLVFLEANIGTRKGVVDLRQAQQAVLPMYPVHTEALHVDLTHLSLRDHQEAYWSLGAGEIEQFVKERLNPMITRSEVRHLSVFALAPIPLLVYLGQAVGDIIPGSVYPKIRTPDQWGWPEVEADPPGASVFRPELGEQVPENVALSVSVSDQIQNDEVKVAMEPMGAWSHYRLTTSEPRVDSVRTLAQANLLVRQFRDLLSEIRRVHGPRCVVHLFAAVPNALAVRFGQGFLPKADPTVQTYIHHQTGFSPALRLMSG